MTSKKESIRKHKYYLKNKEKILERNMFIIKMGLKMIISWKILLL